MDARQCTRCAQMKTPAEFHRRAKAKSGLSNWCKACFKEHQQANRQVSRAACRRYREANKEQHATYNAAYRREHKDRYRSYQNARRALAVGSSERHTWEEWLKLKEECGYACLRCGAREPIISLTADHVIPLRLGGSDGIGNIQPLCKPCNSSKHTDMTDYRPSVIEEAI